MAKKKRQAKSARALRRRVARLEVLVAAFRGSGEGWEVLRDARISNGTVSDGGKVASGWHVGGYTRPPTESEDALCAGGTDARKACDPAVTREAYHQIKERASIRRAVIRGVRRAVSMFK